MSILTTLEEEIYDLKVRNDRLEASLLECLKLIGFLACCARSGESLSEKEETWITQIVAKALKVRSDAPPTDRPPD